MVGDAEGTLSFVICVGVRVRVGLVLQALWVLAQLRLA